MLTVFAFVHKSSHRGVSLSSLSPSLYFAAAFAFVVLVLVVVSPLLSYSYSRFKKKKTHDPNRNSDCAAILELN